MEKYLKSCDISNDFCALNSHLQNSPLSSAAIEKVFSNFSFVHSKVRNKLSNKSASKLVFCYLMVKLKQQKSGYEVTDIFQFEDF